MRVALLREIHDLVHLVSWHLAEDGLRQGLDLLELGDVFHFLLQCGHLPLPVRGGALHERFEALLLVFESRLARMVVLVLHVIHVVNYLRCWLRPDITNLLFIW